MESPMDTAAVTAPVPTKPAAPEERLNDVVRRVQMELVSGRAAKFERGAGVNPYDTGRVRDVWNLQRRA